MRYKIEGVLDIGPGEPFTFQDQRYPSNWTTLVGPNELAAIGMIAYEPEVPPNDQPPLPITVPAVSALLALDDAGLLDTVTAMINAHPIKAVKIWFDKAQYWREDDPYVQALSLEIGLTDEQVNALFQNALMK